MYEWIFKCIYLLKTDQIILLMCESKKKMQYNTLASLVHSTRNPVHTILTLKRIIFI